MRPDPTVNGTATLPPARRGLADVVVELGFADAAEVRAASEAARTEHRPLAQVLLAQSAVTEDQLARALAERFGCEYLDLIAAGVDMGAAALLTPAAARRYGALPVGYVDDGVLLLAVVDPASTVAIDEIAMITGLASRVVVVAPAALERQIAALETVNSRVQEAFDEALAEHEEGDELEGLQDLDSPADAPVVKLVNSIIAQAVERGSSDIHFDPEGHEMAVNYRIDGVLVPASRVPRRMVAAVVSRVKIMTNLDIAERRLPQDGRVSLAIDDRVIDLRVVTLPTVDGEAVVMRVLDKSRGPMTLDALGLPATERARLMSAITEPNGAVLVTGPTGSGKTTTLYAALGLLHDGQRSIVTIEDPVEYGIRGVKQIQTNARVGLTFDTGLRSIMRGDPDTVMVGEVRDRETAQMAIEAALTGHLVLTTLHTRDAAGAVTRLTEMGIEPFLVASAVTCVLAQRLVRTLCTDCKHSVRLPPAALRGLGYQGHDDVDAFEGAGCSACVGTGYRGRIGIYEVMPMTDEIRRLTVERQPSEVIGRTAELEGMRRMRDDGLAKVRTGITSVAEVLRVIGAG
jgi:type IV pilus assembly protein PilB